MIQKNRVWDGILIRKLSYRLVGPPKHNYPLDYVIYTSWWLVVKSNKWKITISFSWNVGHKLQLLSEDKIIIENVGKKKPTNFVLNLWGSVWIPLAVFFFFFLEINNIIIHSVIYEGFLFSRYMVVSWITSKI